MLKEKSTETFIKSKYRKESDNFMEFLKCLDEKGQIYVLGYIDGRKSKHIESSNKSA